MKLSFGILKRSIDFLSLGYPRTFALILSLGLGACFPKAQSFSFLIQYLIMLMLFFSFLDVEISYEIFNRNNFVILAANIAIAFISYFALLLLSHDLALVAFITAITPTATAAPVIVDFLKGKVEYVVASVILTNLTIALILPFVLPFLIPDITISTLSVLRSVLMVIFIPLILAQVVKKSPSTFYLLAKKLKSISFYAWLVVLFLATAKASHFILMESSLSLAFLFFIALVSLTICIANFSIGKIIGGQTFRKEASQSLGQKNTSFTIWLSLTFINPLVALGPTFYVIYHNLYNSYQLFEEQRKVEIYPDN